MARRDGAKIARTDAPTYPVEYELYVTAYLELDTERSYLAPIPWTAKAKYCEFYGLDGDQTEWMMTLLKRIDNAVLVERQKEAKASGTNPTRPSPRHGNLGKRG